MTPDAPSRRALLKAIGIGAVAGAWPASAVRGAAAAPWSDKPPLTIAGNAHEQGLASRELTVEELFHPSTLMLEESVQRCRGRRESTETEPRRSAQMCAMRLDLDDADIKCLREELLE